MGQEMDSPGDRRADQDDGGGAVEGKLEPDAPCELGVPAEHGSRGGGEGRPDMCRAAHMGGGDGETAHRRGADRCGGGASGECVKGDESERGPGGDATEDWREGGLDKAGEYGDLEAAEHQKVDQARCDEGVLKLGWDSLPHSEDDADKHRPVWRRNGGVDGGGVAPAKE